MPQFGERAQEVLTAIVETFISTGEPVGSRTLAVRSRERLSAATIRNVMADLTDAGFLDQPHTSAGRVPTASAYRYYVEQISGTARLTPARATEIQEQFAGVTDPQEFLERTSHVLSLISQNVGVAVSGTKDSNSKNSLEHVYFSRLADQRVLAVVVTRAGVVRDRILRNVFLTQSDLDVAARYLNENFRGWTMESVRGEMARRLQQERGEYDRIMSSLQQLVQQGALTADPTAHAVFVEGASNLVAQDADRQRVSELLRTLEEKQRVVRLLDAYLDTRQEAVRVVIGLDETLPSMQNFVLIGAPARMSGEVMGSLAVIGPTRMDYQQTITAVSYIARLFDELLNEAE